MTRTDGQGWTRLNQAAPLYLTKRGVKDREQLDWRTFNTTIVNSYILFWPLSVTFTLQYSGTISHVSLTVGDKYHMEMRPAKYVAGVKSQGSTPHEDTSPTSLSQQ